MGRKSLFNLSECLDKSLLDLLRYSEATRLPFGFDSLEMYQCSVAGQILTFAINHGHKERMFLLTDNFAKAMGFGDRHTLCDKLKLHGWRKYVTIRTLKKHVHEWENRHVEDEKRPKRR